MSSSRRRVAVAHLRRRFGVSERRACRVVGQHRSTDGRPLRILNVVDEYTRIALGVRVARRITAGDVIVELEALFARHGTPRILRSENGREFTSQRLSVWLAEQGVGQAFVERGSPQQNAYVERFNGTMRDEILNGESLHSVLEARVVLTAWLEQYNSVRPHRGLGMRTPEAFLETTSVGGA